jgi:hypothetical protein
MGPRFAWKPASSGGIFRKLTLSDENNARAVLRECGAVRAGRLRRRTRELDPSGIYRGMILR